jgi:hypothetical protein
VAHQTDPGVDAVDDNVVNDQTVADTGADGDDSEPVIVAGGAEPVLGFGQRHQIIVHCGGKSGGFLQDFP